jgi:NAD(P)-dependent dehydrogenase (short-subunit alcohol dehydrogenase family)
VSTWFITGCSTGFGRALAKAVLAHGHQAVVTARSLASIEDIVTEYPDRAISLSLDVTDHNQVVAAVRAAVDHFGGIDVLVNNAGYGYRAAVEEGERDAIEAMFATNFYAPIDLIQQVLPGMRDRRSGTVVNMSSVGGRTAQPGSAFYAASKFAIEGMSDALRKEVEPHGIRVILIEPGPFRTDFAGRSLVQSEVENDAYLSTAGTRRKEREHMDGNQPGDPAKAAEAIITVVAAEHPPLRLLLGNNAYERMHSELEAQMAEIVTWEKLGRATDF